MKLENFSDEYYEIVHLTQNIDVSGFRSKKGYGLEVYLKEQAMHDEMERLSRTYLVLNSETKQIAAYFTLRTGLLIEKRRGLYKGVDAYSGIELANFAVNDSYREVNEVLPKFGSYVFQQFILPLTMEITKYVGAAYLYIYALPSNKLLAHYEEMGFCRAPKEMEKYIYSYVKPVYDKGCILMIQKL